MGEASEAALAQAAAPEEEEVASPWAGGPVWEASEATLAARFPSVRSKRKATWV